MFNAVTEALNDAENRYNITNMKIDAYVEAVLSQYEINCKKAELKVMKESGTVDDFWYLQEAAGSNLVESLKKAIKKIIESFRSFVNEIKLKILSMITSKSSKEKIDKIEKKVKFNPFLSKKKVQVKDHKKVRGIIAWVKAEIRKILALIKTGKEVAKEKIPVLKEEFKKRMLQVTAIASAVTITAGVAIGSIKKKMSTVNQDITKADKETAEDIKAIEDAGGEKHEESFTELEKLAALRSEVGKEEVNDIVDEITGDLQIVGQAVTKNTEKTSDGEEKKDEGSSTEESVEDSMFNDMKPNLGELFGESETDQMLKDIENGLFNESSDDDDDTDTSDADDLLMEDFDDSEFDFEF